MTFRKIFYYILVTSIVICLYIYLTSSPLLFDSNDSINLASSNISLEGTSSKENLNNSFPEEYPTLITPPLSSYDKIRRWLYWQMKGKNSYVTREDFNKSWHISDSLRHSLKQDFYQFKKTPSKFLKEHHNQYSFFENERRKRFEQEMFNSSFVQGKGYLSATEIRQLARQGYEIRHNKIMKIKK